MIHVKAKLISLKTDMDVLNAIDQFNIKVMTMNKMSHRFKDREAKKILYDEYVKLRKKYPGCVSRYDD